MIIKIGKSGHSFKGLSEYLTHDPEKAQTSERVAWTHTRNLVNDFVPAAVDEMLWTSRDAELLKQEAGFRGGGRRNKHPVKHISLSWHPADNPSDRHMLEASQHFLKSMGWHEHQAIFVAHNDKAYRHIHIILNEIHPETGRTLKDGWEHNHARKWADAYERENGLRCPQRAHHPHRRKKSMPRNIWMAFKNSEMEFEKSEQQLRRSKLSAEYRKSDEWEILKEIHKSERERHFVEGKIEFKQVRNLVYRQVHEEFRERWSDYYKAVKNTVPEEKRYLNAVKAQLVADEKAKLDPQRDAAIAQLKAARTLKYQALLAGHRLERAEFRDRLENGLDNADFFHRLAEKAAKHGMFEPVFRLASQEVGMRAPKAARIAASQKKKSTDRRKSRAGPEKRDIANVGARRVVWGVGSFFDALFTELTNLGSAKPSAEHDPGISKLFDLAAEEATKQNQREQTQKIDDEERSRQRHVYRE